MDNLNENSPRPAEQARNLQKDFDTIILKSAAKYEPNRLFVSALTSEERRELKDLKKKLVELVKDNKHDQDLRTLCKSDAPVYERELSMIDRNRSNVNALQMSETGTRKKIDKIYKDVDAELNDENGCGGCSPFSTKPTLLYEDA